jgi:hypothetical protein
MPSAFPEGYSLLQPSLLKAAGVYPDESLEGNEMKTTPTKKAPFCPACDTQLYIPGLQRCNSCGTECYLDINETDPIDQTERLLQSWGVILKETWTTEPEIVG